MNRSPDILISSDAPADCQQVLNVLFLNWPEEPQDEMSSALLDHLGHCRSCLRKWIALEAAADLACLPVDACDDASAEADDVISESRSA